MAQLQTAIVVVSKNRINTSWVSHLESTPRQRRPLKRDTHLYNRRSG